MKPTKLIIEVMAGVLPDEALDEYSRRWTLTAEETKDQEKLTDTLGAAMLYAVSVANPQYVNWVRWEWTWV